MKSIDADIKAKKFLPVYLFYGEEVYLKRQYKEKLKKSLVQEGDTMNLSMFQGKEISIEGVLDLADTMPFFAERRLIVIENSGLFKSSGESLSKEREKLVDYMKKIPGTTCILFVETEVDKRSKMYKNVKAAGRVVEFSRQTEKVLTQWILKRITKENKKITQNVMNQFLNTVGNDMESIDKELEKLLCYCTEKEVIEKEDVEAVCTVQITNRIFDMIHALATKKQKEALGLYYDLLALKEPPIKILFLITRQFRILLQLKELSQKGYDDEFIVEKVGIPKFALKRNREQARYFTKEQLYEAVNECIQREEEVKTGKLNDLLAVELFLIKYSV